MVSVNFRGRIPEALLDGECPRHCPKMERFYCMADPDACRKDVGKEKIYSCENALYISRLSRLQNERKRERSV
jgi:hypothetical protein